MKVLLSILTLISITTTLYAGTVYDGKWQGVIIRAGQSIEDGTLIYAEFTTDGNSLNGRMREEIYNTERFAVKKISGTVGDEGLSFRQIVIEKSSKTSRMKWCRYSGELTYNPETGYLEGTFESSDCRRVIGKIIMYRSDFTLSREAKSEISHIWYDQFLLDYKDGLNAPEIRKIERENFVFEPIFFDFDKYEIRVEHDAFLKRLIKVVKGHSDLRVRVTGHTDADGTNAYNDALSRNRAQAIIDYFVRHGLDADRLEFDFKGENDPIDTNATSEGKQRNRRVDFAFI